MRVTSWITMVRGYAINVTIFELELAVSLLPILCFAFFFESMLIPVSNAFRVKDHNGSIGMRSSLIALSASFLLYASIVPLIAGIKYYYGDSNNWLLYLTVYQIFDYEFSIAALAIMSLLALL